MKVCTNCHLSFPDSASHCTQCGAPLTTVADQPPVYSGDPLDHTAEFDPADISANKVFALIPYLMGWVGVIITLLASSSSPYAGFHVRQALKIQIAALLSLVLAIIPFLGWVAAFACKNYCYCYQPYLLLPCLQRQSNRSTYRFKLQISEISF